MKALEHIRCGAHSGIPWCCIAWYLTGWTLLVELDHRVTGTAERIGDIDFLTSGLSIRYLSTTPRRGYIPCPCCRLTGWAVELQACDCDVDGRMR